MLQEAGTRLDGRGLDEFRDAILSIGKGFLVLFYLADSLNKTKCVTLLKKFMLSYMHVGEKLRNDYMSL